MVKYLLSDFRHLSGQVDCGCSVLLPVPYFLTSYPKIFCLIYRPMLIYGYDHMPTFPDTELLLFLIPTILLIS